MNEYIVTIDNGDNTYITEKITASKLSDLKEITGFVSATRLRRLSKDEQAIYMFEKEFNLDEQTMKEAKTFFIEKYLENKKEMFVVNKIYRDNEKGTFFERKVDSINLDTEVIGATYVTSYGKRKLNTEELYKITAIQTMSHIAVKSGVQEC